MKSKDNYFAGIVAVAIFLAVVWYVFWVIEQQRPQLQQITVDGIAVDLRDRPEKLSEKLGERFYLHTGDDTQLEALDDENIKFYCANAYECEYFDSYVYAINDMDAVLLHDGSPSGMSFDEYLAQYEKYAFVYGNEDVSSIELIQLDGKLITPEKLYQMMEEDGVVAPETSSDVRSYLMDIAGKEIEEYVILQCWFTAKECSLCVYDYFYAQIKEKHAEHYFEQIGDIGEMIFGSTLI